MLGGPRTVLAHLVTVHSESVGILFSEKDPSAIHKNLALALGHRIQTLAAALVRLPEDIVDNLGPAEPEHLLLQGLGKVNCEGRAAPTYPPCGHPPPSQSRHPKAGRPAA